MRTLPFLSNVAVALLRAVCMLPVATKASGGAAVGLGFEVAVAIGVGARLVEDVVAPLAPPEGVAVGLVGVLAQPASPTTTTRPTNVRRNEGGSGRRDFPPSRSGLAATSAAAQRARSATLGGAWKSAGWGRFRTSFVMASWQRAAGYG
jgi:hypothetical protein